jgi:hypothetical protein
MWTVEVVFHMGAPLQLRSMSLISCVVLRSRQPCCSTGILPISPVMWSVIGMVFLLLFFSQCGSLLAPKRAGQVSLWPRVLGPNSLDYAQHLFSSLKFFIYFCVCVVLGFELTQGFNLQSRHSAPWTIPPVDFALIFGGERCKLLALGGFKIEILLISGPK